VDSSELARFEALMLPHLDAAYSLARYWTRNEQDAEDIVQDAYLKAFRHFPGYRGDEEGAARAWLLTIVRNTAHTSLRRGRLDAALVEFVDAEHSLMSGGSSEEWERQDAKDSLARALDRLPAEFREVILLREIQGLSYKEISGVTGVPVGTVMSRLSRARSRLQGALLHEERR
jgi:RNA polymerase sigma-70 factor (ECF subfamily)